ncbi:hypothetical protein Y1Q_0002486 [Alligator mississippiensis]|uniref:Uncharacterized protein n=1 Tax=Alligator mississippiensis TaxID=8496 RepID=A0A151NBN4_ALLMI|nr:hypothetical protein Y1Q_0002486 [Alligator mississippiensis]
MENSLISKALASVLNCVAPCSSHLLTIIAKDLSEPTVTLTDCAAVNVTGIWMDNAYMPKVPSSPAICEAKGFSELGP